MSLSNTPCRCARRPRLALVLGCGGVRSAAALGVADALAAAGVRPELIVGCSSGALFGACIAAGMAGDAALRSVTRLWSPEVTQQRRWRAYAQLLAPRLAGFDAGFSLRRDHLMAERIRAAFGDTRIQDLPTPLRVAATDAATGRAVVLSEGRLETALRASMAMPLLFPSVEVDGRRLVDGAVSDPLPVSQASEAQVVVALGFEGAMPRHVDRASRLVAQAGKTLINNLQRARLAAARASGQRVIAIELALDRRVGRWETEALVDLYHAGRHATRVRLPEIVDALDRQGGLKAA